MSRDVEAYSNGKIKIDGNFLELVPDDISHAYNEHLKAKEYGDIDLSIMDFENIPFYIEHYDELLYAIRYKNGNTRICLSKKIPNGIVLIIETVSKSRGSVAFKNMIGVTEDKYTVEYENKYKKRNSTNTRGSKSSNVSLRDETVSIYSIHNINKEINEQSVKNSDASSSEDKVQNSVREIVGQSGKSYGVGVYLDGNLLTGLTENERRENYFLLISQYKDSDGNTINIPVYVNDHGTYNRIIVDTNKIATVFGKKELNAYLQRQVSEGNLVRIKNRSTQASESQSPIDSDYSKSPSNKSIRNSYKKINEQSVKNSDANTSKDKVQNSVREIVSPSGKNYGVGVYLDSNIFDGLNPIERERKVKSFVVDNLAGKSFVAYDNNNNEVEIEIAKADDSYRVGYKSRSVLPALYQKMGKKSLRQESVALADELISVARYDSSTSATKSHGWIDKYGKSDWDYWTVYIQEQNGNVWKAILNVANTKDGRKLLYEIDPFEPVEVAESKGSSDTKEFDFVQNSDRDFSLSEETYKQNCTELVRMNSVANLVGNELDGDLPLRDKIKSLFNKWGNNIATDRFGNIALTDSSIRSEIRHGSTRNKTTAYAAIPQVLKEGTVIDVLTKNRGEVKRIVIAAPITIAGTPYFMGVMLQQDTNINRLYVHDVVLKKEASQYQAEHLNTTGPVDTENLFITDVLEKAISVGYSISQDNVKSQEQLSTHNTNSNSKKLDYVQNSDRDFSYGELVSKGDLVGVIINKNQQIKLTSDGKIDENYILKAVRNRCKTLQTQSSSPTFYVNVPDIGKAVYLDRNGITHSFINKKGSSEKINARISLELPKILQYSIEVNRGSRPGNKNVPYSHIMLGTAALENGNGNLDYYAVRFVVEERINQNPILVEANVFGRLRGLNAKNIGSPPGRTIGKGKVRAGSKAYKYNIARLLANVKSEFDDTFSNDVYKHFGMQRNDKGILEGLQFCDRDNVSVYDLMGEVDRLINENKKIREDFEKLKERLKLEGKLTHGKVLNQNQLNTVAGHLKRISGSKIDKVKLMKRLNEEYLYLMSNSEVTWDTVMENFYDIAREIVEVGFFCHFLALISSKSTKKHRKKRCFSRKIIFLCLIVCLNRMFCANLFSPKLKTGFQVLQEPLLRRSASYESMYSKFVLRPCGQVSDSQRQWKFRLI